MRCLSLTPDLSECHKERGTHVFFVCLCLSSVCFSATIKEIKPLLSEESKGRGELVSSYKLFIISSHLKAFDLDIVMHIHKSSRQRSNPIFQFTSLFTVE